MENRETISWVDLSDNCDSSTEELKSSDPLKELLLESINSSEYDVFNFKIENLPYTVCRNEEISHFLDIIDDKASIRMQYKAKKFIGSALVTTTSKQTAIKIGSKYGSSFNGRSILIYYKATENSQWIPQKKTIKKTESQSFLPFRSPPIRKKKPKIMNKVCTRTKFKGKSLINFF